MSMEPHALLGTVLDSAYRIDRLLGEGGMGAVYAATQLRLEKPVAIKVMSRELAAKPDALARFHREAKVTSGLGHPHIVQVFDFSTTPGGEPFIVMEFLDGEDLEHRLRRSGRLTPPETLHIVRQVASALQATHGKGIVHRDLKPANIYLLNAAGETDFVKVLDFGISKMAAAATKLTRTLAIVGTPNYMSPEQAEGKNDDIDERTDQWALACIAWECLAGEMLFDGENAMAILLQIVNKPPRPLLGTAPDVHPAIEDVLTRALAKSKADRFASVSDFAAALEAAITGRAASALPSPAKTAQLPAAEKSLPATTFTRTAGEARETVATSRTRFWIWGLAVSAAALLMLGGFLLLRPAAGPRPTAANPAPALPAAEPSPTLLAEPPPPVAPVAPAPPAKAESAPPPPAMPSEPVTPKPKKAKRSPTPEPKPEAPAAVREPPPSPPRKESQDQWRLD
jgi:serine/threonine-protein kinase